MEEDKIIILMEHTIHHNEHHAEDFISIADELDGKGAVEAANLARSAAKDVENAVSKLREAKDMYTNN